MPSSQPSEFDPVEAAVADIAAGRMVIVTDDERRENEGDLIMAASRAAARRGATESRRPTPAAMCPAPVR